MNLIARAMLLAGLGLRSLLELFALLESNQGHMVVTRHAGEIDLGNNNRGSGVRDVAKVVGLRSLKRRVVVTERSHRISRGC